MFRYFYVEFELFVNHICLFVTILYCVIMWTPSLIHYFSEIWLNINYIVSLDYYFSVHNIIQTTTFSVHSRWINTFKVTVVFNYETSYTETCTVTKKIVRISYHDARTTATPVLYYLKIQVYQTIFPVIVPFQMCTTSCLYRLQINIFILSLFEVIMLCLFCFSFILNMINVSLYCSC